MYSSYATCHNASRLGCYLLVCAAFLAKEPLPECVDLMGRFFALWVDCDWYHITASRIETSALLGGCRGLTDMHEEHAWAVAMGDATFPGAKKRELREEGCAESRQRVRVDHSLYSNLFDL